MTRFACFAALCCLVACTADPGGRRPDRREPDPDTGDGGEIQVHPPIDTSPIVDTSTTPEPWYDCAAVGQAPFAVTTYPITTEEDFDFDSDGYLIHQTNGDLVGLDQTIDYKLIAPQVNDDPAGVSVLASGLVAMASPATATLKLVDPTTGGDMVLASGLSRVNSIDVGFGDVLYFTEMSFPGRVNWVDSASGDRGVIWEGDLTPNGVALSPDENTVYFTAPGGYVAAVDRDGAGWTEPRIVVEMPTEEFTAIEVDVCGTIWLIGYTTGRIVRVPVDGAPEQVGKVDAGAAYFANAHFGNGIGGWRRDTLYVTNRIEIFAISVGVPGRMHPTNPFDGPDP